MAIYTQLNKLWRIVGTGLAFAYFGIGAAILGNIYMLAIRLRYRDPILRRKYSQRSIQLCFHSFVATLKFLRIIDYKIEGVELLQQDKGCLIVANHPSLIDYVLLGSVLPEMDCVVKEALFHNPFCKMVVKNAGYIANSADPQQLLASCKQRLAQGGKLLIFPEGTRTPLHSEGLKLQRGAANLAIRCQVPMRIVHIVCEPRSLSKEQAWYQVPERKSFFYVKVQELYDIAPYLAEDVPESKAVRRLNRDLANLLQPTVDMIELTRKL
ncbi:lysophospholipid acyltransferase family protein [Gallibacterium trehalosifermentans]|uniref:Lysophospholipid acyltransferase family protein n=1 Tax=Gallibacterium trehalosifermentans TaxID=516935 RepID=A0ABV6H089_9PAST